MHPEFPVEAEPNRNKGALPLICRSSMELNCAVSEDENRVEDCGHKIVDGLCPGAPGQQLSENMPPCGLSIRKKGSSHGKDSRRFAMSEAVMCHWSSINSEDEDSWSSAAWYGTSDVEFGTTFLAFAAFSRADA